MSMMVILIVLAGVVVALVGVYNGLVAKKIEAESAWSKIEVQLKRRHDLIPNIAETVKGYAKHESGTLEAVIKARNSAITAGQSGNVQGTVAAENALSGSLRQLFALSESYPDLKANQNYLQLQGELGNTENIISASRESYNNAVAAYNTAIQQVPGNIVANFGSFTKKEFFEVSAEEKQAVQMAPKVSF